MPEVEETKAVYRRVTWLLLLVNLAIPAFVLVQRNGNRLSDTANICVGWIAATMLTLVLLTSTYHRLPTESRRIPRSMLLTGLALVLLSGLITTVSVRSSPTDNYLALALSDKPLNEIKPERRRLIVELIRRNKAASDQNSRTAKAFKPISPALYSADSFANKTAMDATSAQLRQAYDIDKAYASANHQARQAFHDQMQKVDPDYLRSFDSRMQKDDSLEASIEAEESTWVASALSLYDYAGIHASDIALSKDGHLAIASEYLKQNLLKQINASRALQQMMMDDRAKALKSQHSLQDALGMKRSD